jgi:hypothetical protein
MLKLLTKFLIIDPDSRERWHRSRRRGRRREKKEDTKHRREGSINN